MKLIACTVPCQILFACRGIHLLLTLIRNMCGYNVLWKVTICTEVKGRKKLQNEAASGYKAAGKQPGRGCTLL